MTAPRKLPVDAFAFYVALGDGRSYQAVADAYEVTKRAVVDRAAEENWQERVEAIDKVAQESAEADAADTIADAKARHLRRSAELHHAITEVATPQRMKAVLASLIKEAVNKGDVSAARFVFDRVYGKPRAEALAGSVLDLPAGLDTTCDITKAANALLQAVANGTVTPEDAQKAAAVIEAARKAIETQELEERLSELEERMKKENGR